MRKIVLIAAAILLVSAPARGGEGHATPEALVDAFCARLADGDFAGAVSLAAFETEEPDFAELATLRGAILFNGTIPAPGYMALNGELARNTVMMQIRTFLMALLVE